MGSELGELIGPTQARREGHGLAQRLLHFGWQGFHHRRVEQARRDGADTDAEAGQFARDGQGHADDAGLGCCVGGLADLAIPGRHRSRVDDHAAFAGGVGFALAHRLGGNADHVESANEVDVDDAREVGQLLRAVLVQHLFGDADAGAVDQALQAAEARQRLRHAGQGIGLGADIGALKRGAGAELDSQRSAAFGIQVGDDDIGALAVEGANRGFAESRGAAGDNESGIVEFHLD